PRAPLPRQLPRRDRADVGPRRHPARDEPPARALQGIGEGHSMTLTPDQATTAATTTHEVLNQAPPRDDLDEYGLTAARRQAVGVFAPAADTERPDRVGRPVGTAGYQRAASPPIA